jgi:uncharacterized protein YgiM (DUF1202 family)
MKKLCMIVSLVLVHSTVYAADLFVQGVKTKIHAKPTLGSTTVTEVPKGEKLVELEKKGGWFKVSYKDKIGWVSRLVVGPRPPSEAISVFDDSEKDLESGARRRASAFTTGAAARGLTEDRKRLSDQYRVDYGKLEAMEALKISNEEALEFLQEGIRRQK